MPMPPSGVGAVMTVMPGRELRQRVAVVALMVALGDERRGHCLVLSCSRVPPHVAVAASGVQQVSSGLREGDRVCGSGG